jgi:hypothetical protein
MYKQENERRTLIRYLRVRKKDLNNPFGSSRSFMEVAGVPFSRRHPVSSLRAASAATLPSWQCALQVFAPQPSFNSCSKKRSQ